MHMLLFQLIWATSPEDAVETAKQLVLDRFINNDTEFDYLVPFDKDDYSNCAGVNRWKDVPAVMKADSPEAMKTIDEILEVQRKEFDENITAIYDILSKTSGDDLFENEDIRWRCDRLSYRIGPHYRLYSEDMMIARKKDLESVYKRYANRNDGDKKLSPYLVPFDAHF